jgi:MFS family permease
MLLHMSAQTGTTSPQPAAVRNAGTSPAAMPAVVRGLTWTPAIWLLLVVVCGVLFLDGLDLSMIGVALPSIGHSLHLGSSSLQWIMSGYVLAYGGFLLLGGRTSDLVSRRTVFLIAVTVFGAASMVSAALSNEGAIVALRFVKGASAGFTVPAGLSILTTTFAEGPARNRALGIYSACGASGFSLGLVIGGLLTEVGWRLAFLTPGPVALLLVVMGWRVIPRTPPTRIGTDGFRLAHFDLSGAFTATGSVLLLVYAVVEAPTRGWTSMVTVGLVLASLALMATFVLVELRHPHPLVRLGILRNTRLVHANLSAFAMFGSYAAFQFTVTLYVQDALGWSPIETALAFLPTGLIIVACAAWVEPVIERLGTLTTVLAGFATFTTGYALFLRVSPTRSYADFMLPTMLMIGLGMGFTFAALNAQATAGIVDREQGLASGLLNTSLQVGGALVLAVVTAILSAQGTPAHDQLLPHMKTAISVVVGVSAVSLLITAAVLLRSRRLAPPLAVQLSGVGSTVEDAI